MELLEATDLLGAWSLELTIEDVMADLDPGTLASREGELNPL